MLKTPSPAVVIGTLVQLVSAVIFAIPLLNINAAYTVSVTAALAVAAMDIHNGFGMVKFNKEWFYPVVEYPAFWDLIFVGFIFPLRPSIVSLIPLTIGALVRIAYHPTVFTSHPVAAKLLSTPLAPKIREGLAFIEQNVGKLHTYRAHAEVLLGFVIVWHANWLGLIFYWQFLRTRYMQSSYIRESFAALHANIQTRVIPKLPAVAAGIYDKVSNYLYSYVDPETLQGTQSTSLLNKCTVQ